MQNIYSDNLSISLGVYFGLVRISMFPSLSSQRVLWFRERSFPMWDAHLYQVCKETTTDVLL